MCYEEYDSMSIIKVGEYEIRKGLYYTREHEWAKMEDDYFKVGITDYAQKGLHEIVYVDLPEVSKTVAQTEPIGTVESVKAISEIYSPLSGKIIKINEELEESPELVNESPYDAGWIVVIKPQALEKELKTLMTSEEYAEFIRKLLKSEED